MGFASPSEKRSESHSASTRAYLTLRRCDVDTNPIPIRHRFNSRITANIDASAPSHCAELKSPINRNTMTLEFGIGIGIGAVLPAHSGAPGSCLKLNTDPPDHSRVQ